MFSEAKNLWLHDDRMGPLVFVKVLPYVWHHKRKPIKKHQFIVLSLWTAIAVQKTHTWIEHWIMFALVTGYWWAGDWVGLWESVNAVWPSSWLLWYCCGWNLRKGGADYQCAIWGAYDFGWRQVKLQGVCVGTGTSVGWDFWWWPWKIGLGLVVQVWGNYGM